MIKEIYFAAGCFWGAQHFFAQVQGVREAVAGYANGRTGGEEGTVAPTYEDVYTDKTGFAETVKVVYDAQKTSVQELVSLFFEIVDPTSVNRQGGDVGTRYRTGVYYTDAAERSVIEAVFEEEQQRHSAPLVVELVPLRNFFPAEERHQAYLDKNPGGYCHVPLKTFRYLRLYQDLRLLLEGESDPVARMANTAALIAERMHFFWTGFYRVSPDGKELVLGPFQGPAACFRIGFGKGVCGTAWKNRQSVVVPDVEQFPGHIACSAASRSEIVVPVFGKSAEVTAVLDIDSTDIGTFDDTDARWLEKLAALV